MAIPHDVYEALSTVLNVITKDPTTITDLPPEYFGRHGQRAFTVENLETIAANHAFDDIPGRFGITELEGCRIRKYLSDGAETYDFVAELRAEFPDFFKHPESPHYLDGVNVCRKRCGLNTISR